MTLRTAIDGVMRTRSVNIASVAAASPAGPDDRFSMRAALLGILSLSITLWGMIAFVVDRVG
jgi:hypothetical protein